MPNPISRIGDEFIEIDRFTYTYSSGEEFCSVVCKASLQLPGNRWLSLEPAEPLARIREARRTGIQITVGPDRNGKVFRLGIMRSILFAALDGELAKWPFRENAAEQTVRIEIAMSARSGESAAVPRPIQVKGSHRLKVATGLQVAAEQEQGRDRLLRVPIAELRRDDGNFCSSNLAIVEPPGVAGQIEVSINQDAQQRFAREALFAFQVAPRRGSSEQEVYPFVFARVGIADAALTKAVVLCAATKIPLDTARTHPVATLSRQSAQEYGWELAPVSALERTSGAPSAPGNSAVYRLSVAHTYVLCIDLDKVQFEIERLFTRQSGPLILEIALLGEMRGVPFETHRLQLRLIGSARQLLLVACDSADSDRAVVIDVDAANDAAPAGLVIRLLGHEAERDWAKITAAVRAISCDRVDCHIATAQVTDQYTLLRANKFPQQFEVALRRGSNWLKIGNARLEFERISPVEARIVALDVGTMAMSMATGGTARGPIETVNLGAMVAQSVPAGQSRREEEYQKLMSSMCGITILESDNLILPAQCVGTFRRDKRLAGWAPTGHHRDDLKERLRLTKAPLEIHLPLYDRRHEDELEVLHQGFVSIPSVKTQICTYSLLSYATNGLSTLVAKFSSPDVPERKLLPEVETKTLLGAVLDALLFVYRSDEIYGPNAWQKDWYFVLTYPASIGLHARQRYYDALDYIARRVQAVFDRDRVVQPGKRGRVRLQLVPESVAACWALLHSGNLTRSGKTKFHRLILFDIGAGTLDVSAVELQSGAPYEIACQTVCFSVPLGGDMLDRAIARDYVGREKFEEHRDPEDNDNDSDLFSRIEAAKREPKFGGHLLIPVERKTAGREPNVPPRLLDKLADSFFKERGSAPIWWANFDPDDPRNANLQAYLRVIQKLIVAPTLRASGRHDKTLVDIDVVISGRAGFFAPLHAAIEQAVSSAWPDRRLKVRLASDFLFDQLNTRLDPSPKNAEKMKGLVARGALLWSRDASLRNKIKTIEQPPRAVHALASFGILIGIWESEDCAVQIEELKNLKLGSESFPVETSPRFPQAGAFIVTLPPLVTAQDVQEILWSKDEHNTDNATLHGSDFARELIDRSIRPIVLADLPAIGVALGSPLPYTPEGYPGTTSEEIFASICLAHPGNTVEVDCSVDADGNVRLGARVNGGERKSWTLSSTFMPQDGTIGRRPE
jgi:hypothetical protein